MPFYDYPLVGKLAVQPGEPTLAQGAAVGQLWSDSNASCGALYIVTCICGCCVTSVQKCGASTFLGLTDTPASFSGQACKRVAVNGAANALVFVCAAGGGDFSGPASSTDNAIVRFNGTGGKTGQNSGITIDDCNNMTLAGTLTRAADQTIDLTGVATRTLAIQNSTVCQVANLDVDGQILWRNGHATGSFTLGGTPTAARTVTVQDATDTLVGRCTTDTLANKTLTTPTIAATGWTNANHAHAVANSGGQVAIACTTGTLSVGRGGTGATTLTDGGFLLGSGTGAITALGQPTNGQLPVGSAGADPVLATITAGNAICVANGAGSITIAATAATACADGTVELATVCELNTGTDTGRAITPDVFAGSEYGTRIVGILAHCPNCACALTVGDGKAYFRVPSVMCGWALVDVEGSVTTASTCGIPTIQLRRVTAACACPVDMLSTKLTIDASEKDSSTAVTAPVINTCNDNVSTGQKVHVDVDIAGTGTKGLYVETHWRAP